jgi:molecular chaperone Hsp33
VALGVFLGKEGIQAAGGFLVQVLPGAQDEDVEQAEENVRGFPGPGEMVLEGFDADQIADRLMAGLGSRARHYSTPVFHCGCNRQRVLRAITALGLEDLCVAREHGETLEVRCRFCAENYAVEPSELTPLIEGA